MAKHTMNVSLTPELEKVVKDFVESGMYGNQSEVVREGLRLLQRHKLEEEAKLEALRQDLAVGIRQLLNGEGRHVTAEEVIEKAKQRMDRSQGAA